MNNWLLFLTLSLLLSSCGGTKNPNQGSGPDSEIAIESDMATGKGAAPKNSGGGEKAVAPSEAKVDRAGDLGQALKSKNEGRVLEMVSSMLGEDGNNIQALNALGIFYFDTGKWPLARMVFLRALDINKTSAGIYNNLGLTYVRENDLARAIPNFKKALELEPKNKAASANLGSIMIKFGNARKAVDLLSTAHSADKGNYPIAMNYAVALSRLHEYDQAIDVYDDLMESHGRDAHFLMNYSLTLVESRKDPGKAKQLLNKLRIIATDPDIIKEAESLQKKIEGTK